MIQLRALAERLRGSLFYVPLLFVGAAGLVAWIAVRLDAGALDGVDRVPLLIPTTVESARSILSTVAGATITVAGIVFSVTVVSVQLASSQYSPRVLRNFLRDRFQQSVIGVVVGTFTYCLFVLATIRAKGPDAESAPDPNLAVTIALVLAVASILAIIAFIDHSARSMQAGEIVERVTEETKARIRRIYLHHDDDRPETEVSPSPPPVDGPRRVCRAWTDGWVQQISTEAVLGAAPPGAHLRLDTRVGAYVLPDSPLLTVWGEGEVDEEKLRRAFVLGKSRTLQQDVAFGIRQLVDVGLRALSTGVNDPTTAYEVVVHLGAVLAVLFQHDLPPRVHADDRGRVLVIPDRVDHRGHVEHAFGQIRVAAAGQPALLVRILDTLGELDELLVGLGLEHRRAPLREQAELVVETVEHADLTPTDRRRVLERADELLADAP